MRRKTTVDDWRRVLLQGAQRQSKSGVEWFEWSTAGDQVVCAQCAARQGRVYSLAELEIELQGHFCCPPDPDDRCRCTVVAAEEPQTRSRSAKATRTAGVNRGCLVFLVSALLMPAGCTAHLLYH